MSELLDRTGLTAEQADIFPNGLDAKTANALLESWGDMVIVLEAWRLCDEAKPYKEIGPDMRQSIIGAVDKARAIAATMALGLGKP